MNSVTIQGRVGKEPVVETVGVKETKKAVFSVAVSIPPRDKGGDWGTEWISCRAWGKIADRVGDQAHKGNDIMLNGKIKTDTWDDANNPGKKISRTFVEVLSFVCTPKQEAQQQPEDQGYPSNW